MKNVVLAAALLTVPFSSFAAPGKPSADEKAIKGVHAKLTAAFKAKDADAIKALGSKNFTEKGPDGKMLNAEQSYQMMKQEFASEKGTPSVEMSIDNLKVKGNKATYESKFKMASTMVDAQGQMGPKGKTHKMAASGVEKVEMVKEGGAWKYNHVEAGSMTMTLDGKPFNPGAPPAPPKKKGKM